MELEEIETKRKLRGEQKWTELTQSCVRLGGVLVYPSIISNVSWDACVHDSFIVSFWCVFGGGLLLVWVDLNGFGLFRFVEFVSIPRLQDDFMDWLE